MNWLLMTFKPPSAPSARRVYIWRKLKRLGAIGLFDAVWVLPDTDRSREQFQWLTTEIHDMGGEALFWKAQIQLPDQENDLLERFRLQADKSYQDILIRLDGHNPDLPALGQKYQQIRKRDYFQSEAGRQVREKLLAAREGEK